MIFLCTRFFILLFPRSSGPFLPSLHRPSPLRHRPLLLPLLPGLLPFSHRNHHRRLGFSSSCFSSQIRRRRRFCLLRRRPTSWIYQTRCRCRLRLLPRGPGGRRRFLPATLSSLRHLLPPPLQPPGVPQACLIW